MYWHLSPRHWLIRLAACLFIAWASLGLVWAAAGDLQAVPPLKARVTDLTNTLPTEQKTALEANLREFEASKGVQIAVLMVGTTQPEPIEQYALRVAEQWKLGRSKVDDGALLLVAKDDRRVRIEVGYGIEGVLTDLVTQRIISEHATPRFRQGDFAGGIEAAVVQMERVISGEALPPPSRNARREAGEGAGQMWPLLFIVVVILGGVLRRVLGRLPGALVVGGIVWLAMESLSLSATAGFAGFFVTLLGIDRVVGRHGHGGGFGHGGGWSSGSGGGFRGGGGGFGGGGSSGRW